MEYLSPKEAAKLLNVHPETLRQMAESNRLPGVKINKTPGGQRRYDKAGIERLAANPELLKTQTIRSRSVKFVLFAGLIIGIALLVIAQISRSEMDQRVSDHKKALEELSTARESYRLQIDTALELKSYRCSFYLSSLPGILATRQVDDLSPETQLPLYLKVQIEKMPADVKENIREGQSNLISAMRNAQTVGYQINEPLIYNNQFNDKAIYYPLATAGLLLEKVANFTTDQDQVSIERDLEHVMTIGDSLTNAYLADC